MFASIFARRSLIAAAGTTAAGSVAYYSSWGTGSTAFLQGESGPGGGGAAGSGSTVSGSGPGASRGVVDVPGGKALHAPAFPKAFPGGETRAWDYYAGKPVTSKNDVVVFTGTAHPGLALEISKHLSVRLAQGTVSSFADGETRVQVTDDARGKEVYVVQSVCRGPDGTINDSLMELLFMVSTFRRSSAKTITAVIPYFPYGRSSTKEHGRTPIASSDVARMLEAMGVDRVVTVDLHRGQIQGFFGPRVPVDNLEAIPIAASYFNDKDLKDPVIVSPGDEGVYRAKHFQQVLQQQGRYEGTSLALCIPHVDGSGEIEFVGDVQDKDCIIVGGSIDSGHNMKKTSAKLLSHGARKIYGFATHGIFSKGAADVLADSGIEEIAVSNTIPLSPAAMRVNKIEVITLAPLIAEAIRRIHEKKSVSSIFRKADVARVGAKRRAPKNKVQAVA